MIDWPPMYSIFLSLESVWVLSAQPSVAIGPGRQGFGYWDLMNALMIRYSSRFLSTKAEALPKTQEIKHPAKRNNLAKLFRMSKVLESDGEALK